MDATVSYIGGQESEKWHVMTRVTRVPNFTLILTDDIQSAAITDLGCKSTTCGLVRFLNQVAIA